MTFQTAPLIAQLATKHHLAISHAYREFVEAGGLMSYGTSIDENIELAASVAAKILNGANPAELLMQQPRRTELIFNRRTAKALGLTIPPSLLLRADEVIE